jgi:hypothetical protein
MTTAVVMMGRLGSARGERRGPAVLGVFLHTVYIYG